MPLRARAALTTPTDLGAAAAKDIATGLNLLLADVFALYIKTKNFHWHMSGPHFRDYHEMLDEQADQLLAMTDPIAERVRKIGPRTLGSIGQIARSQRIRDNEAEFVSPNDMLKELEEDNRHLTKMLREVHDICDTNRDFATNSMIEVWIDETEKRSWYLYEATRQS